MPKRKRMSFTVKKRKTLLTPVRQSSSSEKPRKRGRPKTKLAAQSEEGLDKVQKDPQSEDKHDEMSESPLTEEGRDIEDSEDGHEDQDEDEVDQNDDDDDDDPDSHPTKIPRLTAETVYVRRATISKKWQHLDFPSQQAVRQIFADVARPVIASQLGEKVGRDAEDSEGKSAEAQEAVRKIVTKLAKRLPQMPIPPNPPAGTFDYEKVVRDTGAAEAQLSEQLASIATMQIELKKSTAEKERVSKELEELDSEVRRQEVDLQKRLKSKFGPMLSIPSEEPVDSARRIRLAPRKKEKSVFDSDAPVSTEVRKLMDQLGNHMASLHTNRVQMGDIEAELDHAMAASESFIHRKGGTRRLEAG